MLLGIAVGAVYGSGILMAVWAAMLTSRSMQARGGLPYLPWTVAFVLVLLGMLFLIYGFFFRPRRVHLTEHAITLVIWDGSGKSLSRDQVESVQADDKRVVLRGAGKTLVVDRMFGPWEKLRAELVAWAGPERIRPA